MNTCRVCGKSRETLNTCKVYTARALGQTKEKTGFKEHTFTTTYGDFKEHRYEVCDTCLMRRTYVIPLVVYLVSALLIAFLLGSGGRISFGAVLAYVGGGLFFALLPAGFVFANLDISKTLIRKALADRKKARPNDRYKGYTLQQYKDLKGKFPKI